MADRLAGYLASALVISFVAINSGWAVELSGRPDMIPTPKHIEMRASLFLLNADGTPNTVIVTDMNNRHAVIAAQEINERITELGGRPLPVVADTGEAHRSFPGKNRIMLTVAGSRQSRPVQKEFQQSVNEIASRGEQAYAILFRTREEGERTAALLGSGWQGLLYAACTFRFLIRKEKGSILVQEAQILDWPDFKYRGLPIWPLPATFEEFKKYVDWAFRYKFNRIYTHATRRKSPDGFDLPTQDERHYLKKINTYARQRGILINYALTWAVAKTTAGEQPSDHADFVVSNGQYYTWSNDAALRKRAEEIAQFVKDSEVDAVHLHCLDANEELWDQRGAGDRARFGNDRAEADANVINIYSKYLHAANPDIELQFVVSPYDVNFNLPGNERYKAWITGLTARIPNDVSLVVTGFDRDRADSWAKLVPQPLVHWINGNAFLWGRYFTTLPAFTKSAFYEGRDRDSIINWEPIGYFNGEVMQLIASEYVWNVNAPGSGYIAEDKMTRSDDAGAYLGKSTRRMNGVEKQAWSWYAATQEPGPTAGELLLRACRLEYGPHVAPYVYEFFANNAIGWRSPDLFSTVLMQTLPGKELDGCIEQLDKVNRAITALKNALRLGSDAEVKARVTVLLTNTCRQRLVLIGETTYYKAMTLLASGRSEAAFQELMNGRSQLEDAKHEMDLLGVWSHEADDWYGAGQKKLIVAELSMNKKRAMNLVRNPGFEGIHGKPSLFPWASTGAVALVGKPRSRKYAACLTLEPSEKYIILQQSVTVPPACNGYIEFWMKKEGDFRTIPILQYWSENHEKMIEDLASDDFPFVSPIQRYTRFNGKFRLPSDVREITFKVYGDWHGFSPARGKTLCLDDVFIGCMQKENRE